MTGKPHKIILEVQNVVKNYSSGGTLFTALNQVNIDIQQGEFLGITGKSGAGKTTLLNVISGVTDLTTGSIFFHGGGDPSSHTPVPIHELNEDQLALWRGQNVGVVYQSFELMPTLSLVENVMLPPDLSGTYQSQTTNQRALELLDIVGIADHAHKIPAHISGGQKQRVAIARAMVNNPSIIIADEPTGSLDSLTAETIIQIFEQLVEQGKTVVMVTHDESLIPRFSRWLQIKDGLVTIPAKNGPKPSQQEVAESRFSGSVQIYLEAANASAKKQPDPAVQPLNAPAIVLRDVDKIYENAAGKFVALKKINLQLNYGRFISIVGKSGSGKSTLLNMITGIDHPTLGEVAVANEHIYQMSESKRAQWRGRNLGVVFQFFQLLPMLTLVENVMLPMDYCNVYSKRERRSRAMELLDLVGVADQADKLPTSVSNGQQQSAAIARALATDPSIIVADEPTGNLDSRSADNILNLFRGLTQRGKTVLIVTHDHSITQRTDQTITIADGEIIDPTIVQAMPFLSHGQMLEATHQVEKQKVAPRETILHQGNAVEYFYMIASGGVEIKTSRGRNETWLASLGPGQFFGETELLNGGHAIALVQSDEQGVELLRLPKQSFFNLIDSSTLTHQTLNELAAIRHAENIGKTGAARL
ncbi:MAG TPA: ATP-binding cassette domain-containing protein [Anaerolineales bacterium]|nr:ATP-binding cassette domain-containing protein [Anaerolineales bacterium]